VSGSISRGDALPGSDIESLVVHDHQLDARSAMDRAAKVHELLDQCGFRADDNGAVASRARFCRSADGWDDGIERWVGDPAQDRGVVMIGLLADAVTVAGHGPDLRARMGTAVQRRPSALATMLQDSTSVRENVPSRLRVLATGDSVVDIKHAAVDPVARIARWAALSCGSAALSTIERIRDASGSRFLDQDDARVLDKCHAIGSSIRWRVRAAQWSAGLPTSDRVDLATLSPQDRTALRSIGRELAGVRRKMDYLASTSTFTTW
jgi:CBS domain-containing protein